MAVSGNAKHGIGVRIAAERAQNCVDWLVQQGGVSVSRLRAAPADAVCGQLAPPHPQPDAGGGGGVWHVRFHVVAEIKICDKIEFDGGDGGLRSAAKALVEAVAAIVKKRPEIKRLTIEGHTCTDGPVVRART